jgi:uncharacterized membrane protein YfcA
LSDPVFFFVLAGVAGGFINGFAGTGTALFGLGFLLAVLPPVDAVAVIALLSSLSGLQGLWTVRTAIPGAARRIARFVLPALLGLPLGLWLLQFVNADILRLVVAGFLMLYGGWFGFARNLPRLKKPMPFIDVVIGAFSGVLGGLASLSGSLPAIWVPLQGWPKAEMRAVLQSLNVVVLALTSAWLFLSGSTSSATGVALLVVLPVGILFARVGIWLFHRVSDETFARTLILLCLAMGAGVMLSAVT